jgi:uncharacterized repeat protein (TIGR01451 family)
MNSKSRYYGIQWRLEYVKTSLAKSVCAFALCLFFGPPSSAQVAPNPLEIKAIAEVEIRISVGTAANPRELVKLAPADRLIPGDQVIYTLEIRNTAAVAVATPTVTYPIPEHMLYVVGSAVGPGAEVTYSVDGHHFDQPEKLNVAGADGVLRAATAADYTHIRWKLKHNLKANSVAFARFRALVK